MKIFTGTVELFGIYFSSDLEKYKLKALSKPVFPFCLITLNVTNVPLFS